MNDNSIGTPESDVLLPEGWTEDEDLFAEEAASGAAEGEDANRAPDPAAEGEKTPAQQEDEAPEAPTAGETGGGPAWLRFTARVDHEDREVELDESELPALYQKAQATERAQRRLRELSELRQAEGARDLGAEAEELLKIYPQMQGRSIPTEVVLESLRGQRSLTAAFAAYTERQHQQELAALRRENERRAAGQSAARRAPVRGVSGGGDDPKPADPFLAGFESGW